MPRSTEHPTAGSPEDPPAAPSAIPAAITPQQMAVIEHFDGDFGLDDCPSGPDRDQRLVWDAAWRADPRLLDDHRHLFDLSAREQPLPPLPEHYLDTDQAALYLNVTPRMIRRLVEQQALTPSKIGKYVRFTRADLDAAVTLAQAPPPPSRRSALPDDDPVVRVTLDRTHRHVGGRTRKVQR